MNFYQTEMNRIKRTCYSNKEQIGTVVGVRNFIEDNFEKQLNLSLLSRVNYTSKFHLMRLFKKYYGLTPKQYLINKRIAASKYHLKKGMPVAETCYAVGFESPCSFSTLFKSKTGITPAEFKKKQLLQSECKVGAGTLGTHPKN
ncbi:MAG: transcriptional regulator, AraC family [Ferruginibacter sp.]|uniref:helix-turn-helix domain-containing protein n=1 Tax=Ferruginibacter sp. TaxID=1940288 RepID=UPI0026589E99|nr:AraC family transcriptional regulator [Ferruginibacter sp.]MDB5279657.1 transcriptional regulator, AraC family [Ferruginibacter sp.]